MKNLILEYLYSQKDVRGDNVQFFNGGYIPENIMDYAGRNNIVIDRRGDERLFRETFWELFSINFVTVGSRNGNADRLPWVSITDYGIQSYERSDKFPYDIQGFLKNLFDDSHDIDSVIRLYFEEAVSCFSHNDYLASTVMIGGALEKAILDMTENFKSILKKEKTKYEQDVLKHQKIKKRFDEFLKYIENNGFNSKLSVSHREKLNSLFPAIVNLIRISRNEIGHPMGRQISQDEAQAYILLAKEAVLFSHILLDELR